MQETSSTTTSQTFLYTAIIAAAVLYIIIKASHRRRNSLPPLPPGPPGLPIVGSLPFLDPELHTYFARLAAEHGPILLLRLGSKTGIIITSPSLAREVLRDQDPTFANRDVPAAARSISYGGGQNIVWNPVGPTWRMLRRVCVREMLSPAGLDAAYALRRREFRSTMHHLYENSGAAVDVGAQMFLTTMNVITSTLWGGTIGDEAARTAVGKEFRELISEITELLGMPNVSDFFPALARFDVQGIQKKMAVFMVRLDNMFVRIIQQRTNIDGGDVGERASDFLEYMLKLAKEGGDAKTPFTMTHVKALLMDMVVGGTETTSNTVEWAMAHMMQKPETMRKAQEELDAIVGKDGIVEESHIPQLHYLGLVIKETLRLHPALPLLVPHCPNAHATIGGYHIPAGSRVFINVWAIQRDPSIWADPLEFKPERFLEDGHKWDFSGNDLNYFPFGSGRRICAGIAMAERMTSYSLASLLHSFDWKLPEGEKDDLSEKFGIVMKKAKPLVAIPTPKLSKPELYC